MFLCSWFWRTVGGLSSGLSAVFSRVRGSSGFSLLLASCGLVVGGGGAGCWGFSRVRGWVRLSSCSLWGVGWVRLARPVPAFLCGGWVRVRLVLAPLCFGGWGLGVFVRLVHSWDAVSEGGSGGPAPVFCAGVGCAWFPVSCSRCFLVVFAEGFPGVFVSARRFLPLVWGVSGWVGVVFSPAVLLGPGSGWFLVGGWPGFGFGFGFVWRV